MPGKIHRHDFRVVPNEAHRLDDAAKPPALAIEVKDASLEYPLGSFSRASLKEMALSFFGRSDRAPKQTMVSALNGLSFSIAHGERVALVGHNGSGKSSLLRVLAGIYPLTVGDVSVTGQIGTLLDIGLGFEPEATGRENIYYRGMTMGMSRARLKKVEEEIVSFADLGQFIDLPMRTYSAGMYVRLGFAISTQFSPDILLVDEIFGAGDASFAKRAMTRMLNIVANSGIFVIATHDLQLVENICNRVIWLERGRVVRDDAPSTVLPEYLAHMSS